MKLIHKKKKIKILTIITLCVAWMVISLYFFPGLSHFIYICVVAKKKKTVESAADKVTGPTRCLRHLMQSLANFPRILLIQDLWLLSLSFHPEIENNLVFSHFIRRFMQRKGDQNVLIFFISRQHMFWIMVHCTQQSIFKTKQYRESGSIQWITELFPTFF